MSFFKRLFARNKQTSHRRTEAATRDLDSEYVFVAGPEAEHDTNVGVEGVVLETRSAFAEDPAEVDVSAWEMARNWTKRGPEKVTVPVTSSKSQRLAQRIETIRKMRGSNRTVVANASASNDNSDRRAACSVLEYNDVSMDEETECLFDDKWNRKTKVESRRDRLSKFGA
ncbi:LANO_0F06018g1_1 [Lachancea nothofagi CBS 11611]|uniref:LANO_0F06018g1_1 n=1 Tax=Lachancea nothofagi CBS 11611 TaxID=1266666 RepID=A0A1G4K8A4_9SACH|nr:LANO_0F06018g1_1 [Lachancea nothofagi CBS 11611]